MLEQKRQLLSRIGAAINFSAEYALDSVATHFKALKDELERDLTFNVLTVGDFSSGKSTFINTFFIKNALLPVKATPATAKLTIIRYSEEPFVEIYFMNGSKMELKENIEETLKDYVLKGGNYIDQVDHLEVYINSEYLKNGVIIVDSPGLNDPEIERMKVTIDFIDRSDSILYLLTAHQAWKRSEKEFLEEKILRKEDLDKVFFLLNFWDMVGPEERDDLLNFVRGEIKKSMNVVSAELGESVSEPPLIPISAKTGENYDKLEKILWEYFSSKKGAAILASKIKKFEKLKEQLIVLLRQKIELLGEEDKQLEAQLEQMAKDIEELQSNVSTFKKNLGQKIDIEIENFMSLLGEWLAKVKATALNRIEAESVSISDKKELKQLIDRSLDISQFQNRRIIEAIIKDFCSRIESILDQEKARLKIEAYSISKGVEDVQELKEFLSKSVVTFRSDPYLKLGYLSSIGPVTLAIILGGLDLISLSMLLPLGFAAFGGIAWSYLKGKEAANVSITENIERLKEALGLAFETRLTELKLKKEEIKSNILNNMTHHLIDTLEAKKKAYQEALEQKAKDTTKRAAEEQYKRAIESVMSL